MNTAVKDVINIDLSTNDVLTSNRFRPLSREGSNSNNLSSTLDGEDKCVRNKNSSVSRTNNQTPSPHINQKSNQRHSVKQKQQHNTSSSKSTEGLIVIPGDYVKATESFKITLLDWEKNHNQYVSWSNYIGHEAFYIEPTPKKIPQLLVLQVRTNYIQHKEPEEIAKEVETLDETVVVNGLSKVAISEIIQRVDDELNRNIKKTNVFS